MAALDFWATINPDHTLTLPPEVASKLDREQQVRVILITPGADDPTWEHLTADQFLNGYAPGDVIYDELPAG